MFLRPGISYFFSKAGRNFGRNLLVNLLSVATIAISVFVFLALFLLFRNVSSVVGQAARAGRVVVYLKDSAVAEEIRKLTGAIRTMELVKDVRFTSKEQALKDFKTSLGAHSSIVEGLPFNPLPGSLEILLGVDNSARGIAAVAEVGKRLEKHDSVDSVDYGGDIFDNLSALMDFLRRLGFGVGALMVLAVIFIVANTIRLNIYSRKEEIEVQQLVGASGIFIQLPFLFEGAFQGFAGVLAAEFLLFVVYSAFAGAGQTVISSPFGEISIRFLDLRTLLLALAAGTALGIAGSWLSLGRYIKKFVTHEQD